MKTLIFYVTQSDGLVLEHIIRYDGKEVVGYENIRRVHHPDLHNVLLSDLLKNIVRQPPHENCLGPYKWIWQPDQLQ